MSYNLIHDPEQVTRFNNIFMELSTDKSAIHFQRMMYLAARRKHWPACEGQGSICFNRKTLALDSDLLTEIRKYEVPLGTYTTEKSQIIPDLSLSVYFLCNVLNSRLAAGEVSKKIMDACCTDSKIYDFSNLEGEYKTQLAKQSDDRFFEFDIDTKELSMVNKIYGVISVLKDGFICCIETHGGYHIIVDNLRVNSDSKQKVYMELTKNKEFSFMTVDHVGNPVKKSYVDIIRKACPPVPGTFQGSFKVHFVTWEDLV